MEDANYIVPPAWREELGEDLMPLSECETNYAWKYQHNVQAGQDDGLTRKQAREAARYSLPAGTETKFVVTGNLRAWRDVLKKRDSEFADAEMQLLAKEVKRQLTLQYPNVFKDLNEDRSGGETA
jgi:thymidylate synthase (FAD)